MSQDGKIVFYVRAAPTNLRELLARLIELATPKCFRYTVRTAREDHEWNDFLAGNMEGTPLEDVPDPSSSEDFVSYYKDARCLMSTLCDSPLADRITTAVQDGIAEEIRGRFLPMDLTLNIGYHDIFECSEVEEGQYFARAFIAVEFFGYGTPNDWQAFRQRVFQLPGVISVKRDIEQILGPVEECVFWYI